MSWNFSQLTGNFTDPSGELRAKGYAGQPPHVNDPDAQSLHNLGPIPEGLWQGVELIAESSKLGPYIIRLEPYPQTETFGRGGFFVHGERVNPPAGFASDGCIILARDVREAFWNSNDHDILVIRGGV